MPYAEKGYGGNYLANISKQFNSPTLNFSKMLVYVNYGFSLCFFLGSYITYLIMASVTYLFILPFEAMSKDSVQLLEYLPGLITSLLFYIFIHSKNLVRYVNPQAFIKSKPTYNFGLVTHISKIQSYAEHYFMYLPN